MGYQTKEGDEDKGNSGNLAGVSPRPKIPESTTKTNTNSLKMTDFKGLTYFHTTILQRIMMVENSKVILLLNHQSCTCYTCRNIEEKT